MLDTSSHFEPMKASSPVLWVVSGSVPFSVSPSRCRSLLPSASLFVCVPFSLCISLSVPICIFIYPSLFLCVCPSLRVRVCVSVFHCIPLSGYPSVSPVCSPAVAHGAGAISGAYDRHWLVRSDQRCFRQEAEGHDPEKCVCVSVRVRVCAVDAPAPAKHAKVTINLKPEPGVKSLGVIGSWFCKHTHTL